MGEHDGDVASRCPADSDALIRIAVAIRRGLPLWEIGCDPSPWPEPERRTVDGEPTLYLVTGLRDQKHQAITSDHPKYDRFRWACTVQDTVSLEDRPQFFALIAEAWPRKGGKNPHADAFGFAFAFAVQELSEQRRRLGPTLLCSLGELFTGEAMAEARADIETFCGNLGRAIGTLNVAGLSRDFITLDDAERLRYLERARQMLLAPRHAVRDAGPLPRISESPEAVPTLAEFATFDEHSTAGDASLEIVRSAVLIVEQMNRERETARADVAA